MTTAGSPAVTVFPRALNIAAEYIDRPVAEGRGSSPAVRVASAARETLTYEQLQALVNRAAATLQAAGVEMEQRVGILLPDSTAWLSAFFGAAKLGAVPVPFNTILPASDHLYLLNDSRARALVVDAAFWSGLLQRRAELAYLRKVFVVNGDEGKTRAGAMRLRRRRLSFRQQRRPVTTSPSGSTPRAAPVRPKAPCICSTTCFSASRSMPRSILKLRPTDVVLSAAKLFHAYGFGNCSYFPFAAGATSVLFPAGSVLRRCSTSSPRNRSRCSSACRHSMPRCCNPPSPAANATARRCAYASRRQNRFRRRSFDAGKRALASRSWTESAQRKRCISLSVTRRRGGAG